VKGEIREGRDCGLLIPSLKIEIRDGRGERKLIAAVKRDQGGE
jgi:hypothetical protein